MCKYYLYCTVFEVIFLIFSFKNGFQESHESLGEQNHWFLDKWLFGQTLPRNKALVRQSWFPLRRLTTQLYIKPWREGAIRGSEIFQAPGHWKKNTRRKMIGKHWTQRCWESWESFGKISVPRDRHNWLCGHLYVLTKADLKVWNLLKLWINEMCFGKKQEGFLRRIRQLVEQVEQLDPWPVGDIRMLSKYQVPNNIFGLLQAPVLRNRRLFHIPHGPQHGIGTPTVPQHWWARKMSTW